MSRLHFLATATLIALLVAPLGALPARAADPIGPSFGRNRYKTTLETGPQGVDTDDYVSRLFVGETLTVTVTSPFQSPVIPALTVLDPTGVDRSAEMKLISRRGGRQLRVNGFPIDLTGKWTVRISSLLDTQGSYVVGFRVGSPPLRLRSVALAAGAEAVHTIPGLEGARLDVTVRPRRGSGPVEVRGIDDPSGGAVPGTSGPAVDDVRVRRRRSTLRGATLGSGDGDYTLTLGAPGDAATYDLTVSVRPEGRPRTRRVVKLPSAEPFLEPPPIGGFEGVAGLAVQPQIRGQNISAVGRRPAVLFGEVRAIEFIVNDTGTRIEVEPPEGVDGETVDITVVNPDGQGYTLEDAFLYVPPPTITDVTDLAGVSVRGWSTAGGLRVRIVGENLRSGQIVNFGPSGAIVPLPRNGALEVTTPAAEPGRAFVRITDRFEHEAVSEFEFEFKTPPSFAVEPYDPPVAAEAGGALIKITGQGFDFTDVLRFDGVEIALISMDLTSFFNSPAGVAGTYSIEIEDRLGVVVPGPDFIIKSPGIVDAVTATGEGALGDDEVALTGGATLVIDGSRFHAADTVTLGGADARVTSNTGSRMSATAPPGDAGLADLVVTDAAAQETPVVDALRYVGYADRTADRSPGGSATDDLSARRGVVADLDGDLEEDDVVITSHDSSPGTRAERTRILIGDDDGLLVDRTADDFPEQGGGDDDWDGTALAVGDVDMDVDAADALDILVAGPPPDAKTDGELRIFVNDGAGVFSLDADLAPPTTYAAKVTARDELSVDHDVFLARTPMGLPSALVIGDLDGDDDLDVVMGRDHYESVYVGVDPSKVDFGQVPPYISSADAAAYRVDAESYFAATRVFLNEIDLGNGFVEATDALPSAGDESDQTKPAFHARDVALGDIDGDDDLDIVLTWDDPTTVTASGLKRGAGNDTPRLATRVLLNDGSAGFTDATASWMPAGVSPEFFQADRLALVDLDADDDLDLLLLISTDVNRYQGLTTFTRRALRVFRNDGASTGFTDVSAAAIPSAVADRDENYRGGTLAVLDVNGDDDLDIVVGTTSVLRDKIGTRLRSTRLLLGGDTPFVFRRALPFLPAVTADSGEADDILVISDLAGNTQPSILLLSDTAPAASGESELLRIFDWER